MHPVSFSAGRSRLHSFIGGIQTVFNAILYAAREFMEIIATIALVTALSKCMADLGSDRLLMEPMSKVMKTPARTWWLLGVTMFLFSLFLWPSPSVALVGAIMIPFAVRAGLSPLAAAMAMNLFGHGFALSYDVVIQALRPYRRQQRVFLRPTSFPRHGRFSGLWAASPSWPPFF